MVLFVMSLVSFSVALAKIIGVGLQVKKAAAEEGYGEPELGPTGQRVAAWHAELNKEIPELTRELLAAELSTWGSHHVFGNAQTLDEDDPLPFMSLDAIYVEPAGVAAGASTAPRPLLGLIHERLRERSTVVVQGDFGHGKSLTARRLARDLARDYLETKDSKSNLAYPVFIKCARDITGVEYEHRTAVRRALWHASREGEGPQLSLDFSGFEYPREGQRVLFILDGLDEVAFDQTQLESLFNNINEQTSDRHRVVVFTRPGALHTKSLPRAATLIEVKKFDEARIKHWLAAWSKVSGGELSLSDVDAKLRALAATPILLLMIAMTWRAGQGVNTISTASLYDTFFSHVARGKYGGDSDAHKGIRRASEEVRQRLVDRREFDAARADPAEAMLWLMSRLAWKAHVLAGSNPPMQLCEDHVRDILQRELDLPAEIAPKVQIGLLLAMQYKPGDAGSVNILFGHQSFREYLVARYWRAQLRHLFIEPREPQDESVIRGRLMEGRLLQGESHAFEFLCEMLLAENADVRAAIGDSLERVVNDEGVSGGPLQDDHCSTLRESALALASCLCTSGVRANTKSTIRSIGLVFELRDDGLRVNAPRLKSRGANLRGASLRRAKLRGADLRDSALARADLRDSDLRETQLDNANLRGVDLQRADLRKAQLRGADLHKADLRGVNIAKAQLQKAKLVNVILMGANLSEAVLDHALLADSNLGASRLDDTKFHNAKLVGVKLVGATLRRATLAGSFLRDVDFSRVEAEAASFTRAHLIRPNFREAKLFKTKFDGAKFSDASFFKTQLQEADLRGAFLRDANFREADLRGADLRGADLRGADLRRANLSRVKLNGANLSHATLIRAELAGACLRYANLYAADCRLTRFRSVDFTLTILIETDLKEALQIETDLKEAIMNEDDPRAIELGDADLKNPSEIKLREPDSKA